MKHNLKNGMIQSLIFGGNSTIHSPMVFTRGNVSANASMSNNNSIARHLWTSTRKGSPGSLRRPKLFPPEQYPAKTPALCICLRKESRH